MAKVKFNKPYKDKELNKSIDKDEEVDMTLKRADEIVKTIKGKFEGYDAFDYERLDKPKDK